MKMISSVYVQHDHVSPDNSRGAYLYVHWNEDIAFLKIVYFVIYTRISTIIDRFSQMHNYISSTETSQELHGCAFKRDLTVKFPL